MSKTESQDVPTTAAEEMDLVRYRSVSRLALLSLLLGLLSIVTLLHPLLLIVPVATVIIAVLALRNIAASQDELMGRKLAIVGLMFGLFFAGFAPSRRIIDRQLAYADAQQFGEHWLQMIGEGRLYEAFELHLPPQERQPPGSDLQRYYGELPSVPIMPPMTPEEEMSGKYQPPNRIRRFYATPVVVPIVLHAADGQFKFERNLRLERESSTDVIVSQLYSLIYSEEGRQKESRFVVVMKRHYNQLLGNNYWHVLDVHDAGNANYVE